MIAENEGATIEEINSELIIKGIELGFLDLLSRKYDDLSPLLEAYFDLDDETQSIICRRTRSSKAPSLSICGFDIFCCPISSASIKNGIDPEFSDIVQSIMPLLKNGITPKHQTILNVLQVWAERCGQAMAASLALTKDTGQIRMDTVSAANM